MAIIFSYADRALPVSNKRQLKRWIESVFTQELKHLKSLTYVFCSDDFLLEINQRFLQHDYYTDIITFDLSESSKLEVSGEIYISLDRVRDNVDLSGGNFQKELQRVLVHGALHLCGYKDKRKSEIRLMRDREDHYLRLFEKHFND